MMSRNGLIAGAVAALAALTLAACTSQVAGTPEAAGSPATSAPTAEKSPVAGPGECVDGENPAPVDCARPHTVEITKAGEFGEDMSRPDRDAIFQSTFPACRAEAATYLGSEQYDVTAFGAWLLYPGEADWAEGQRWYRCGVVRFARDGSAASRTGSANGILEGGGVDEHRFCSSALPSKKVPQRIPCDQPHIAEAIATVPMGDATDPYPGESELDQTAAPECKRALTEYLGQARDDVFASWRWQDQASWRQGFNNVICYAETNRPYTGTLSGIGSRPLPR